MPRNGSGVAERVPNTNAISGQTIESADFEASMYDIYSILNSIVPTAYLPTLAAYGGVAKAGDTMTGFLTLSGDATANLHAVTKQQMDAALALKAASTHTHTASQVTDFSAASDARIAAASINALSDVVITAPAIGQAIHYNGTNFVNAARASEFVLGNPTSTGILSAAHGLGYVPRVSSFKLRCLVSEQGWAVGDEMDLASATLSTYRVVPFCSATLVGVVFSTSPNYTITNKSTFGDVAITNSRWTVVAYVS